MMIVTAMLIVLASSIAMKVPANKSAEGIVLRLKHATARYTPLVQRLRFPWTAIRLHRECVGGIAEHVEERNEVVADAGVADVLRDQLLQFVGEGDAFSNCDIYRT
jgi:hypothetical protein